MAGHRARDQPQCRQWHARRPPPDHARQPLPRHFFLARQREDHHPRILRDHGGLASVRLTLRPHHGRFLLRHVEGKLRDSHPDLPDQSRAARQLVADPHLGRVQHLSGHGSHQRRPVHHRQQRPYPTRTHLHPFPALAARRPDLEIRRRHGLRQLPHRLPGHRQRPFQRREHPAQQRHHRLRRHLLPPPRQDHRHRPHRSPRRPHESRQLLARFREQQPPAHLRLDAPSLL